MGVVDVKINNIEDKEKKESISDYQFWDTLQDSTKQNQLFLNYRNPANFYSKPLGDFFHYSAIGLIVLYLIGLGFTFTYHILEVYIPTGIELSLSSSFINDIIKLVLLMVVLLIDKKMLGLTVDPSKKLFKRNLKILGKLKKKADKAYLDLNIDESMFMDTNAIQEIHYQEEKSYAVRGAFLSAIITAISVVLIRFFLYDNNNSAFFTMQRFHETSLLEGGSFIVLNLGFFVLVAGIELFLEYLQNLYQLRLFSRKLVIVHYIKDFLGPAYSWNPELDPVDNYVQADDLRVNIRSPDYYRLIADAADLDFHFRACDYCEHNYHIVRHLDESGNTGEIDFLIPLEELRKFDIIGEVAVSLDCLNDIFAQIIGLFQEKNLQTDFIQKLPEKITKILFFSVRSVRNEFLIRLRKILKIVAKNVMRNEAGDMIANLFSFDKMITKDYQELLEDNREVAYSP